MIKNKSLIIALFFLSVVISSCKDVVYEQDNRYVPVYLSYEDLRQVVKPVTSMDLVKPGKIYFKDGIIFINEEMKGIHIIDNTNPANPLNTGFISIPGNMDMAIKENILYADSYVDLVAIDISDVNAPSEIGRVNDVFPYTLPQLTGDRYYSMVEIDESKGVVVDWDVKVVRQRVEDRYYPFYYGGWYDSMVNLSSSHATPKMGFSGGSTFGIGGSMARFGLNKNHLYTIDNSQFHIFDIQDVSTPKLVNEPYADDMVETVFVVDDHLFLGSRTGMLAYSLANPTSPELKTKYTHIYSCDPVVVQDHMAYVTLRGGNQCGRSMNRLDILSLSNDYSSATLLHTHEMTEPYGLAIDDEVLFVCDGQMGLRVFDASDLATIPQHELARFTDIHAYDVIPFEDHLFMIGQDGFYQYDYSDLNNIYKISHIPVVSE